MGQFSDTLYQSHNDPATMMDYPSTTQALFALIVMIIVLLFILTYCCWGSFSCTQQHNETEQDEEQGSPRNNQQRGSDTSGRMVIVPFSNMIYVGDPDTRRIYQIPIDQDKPPAYTDAFMAGLPPVPPPPYSSDQRLPIADPPPAYEDVLTSSSAHQQPWTTIMLDPSTLDGLDTSILPRLAPNMLPANRVISQLVYQRCSPPDYSSVDDLLEHLDSVNPSTSGPLERGNDSSEYSIDNNNQSEVSEAGDSLLSNGNRVNALLVTQEIMGNSSDNTNIGNTSQETNATNSNRET